MSFTRDICGGLRYGVEEMLDTMVMGCAHTSPRTHFPFFSFPQIRAHLNGVVLAHSDVHFLDRVARLQANGPFAICHVGSDALNWKPTRGIDHLSRI
jgi:DNA-directed RNA polymerase I subunit RPA43